MNKLYLVKGNFVGGKRKRIIFPYLLAELSGNRDFQIREIFLASYSIHSYGEFKRSLFLKLCHSSFYPSLTRSGFPLAATNRP